MKNLLQIILFILIASLAYILKTSNLLVRGKTDHSGMLKAWLCVAMVVLTAPVWAQLNLTDKSPAPNATNVTKTATIELTFDAAIDGGTFNANTVFVTGSLTGEISASFTGEGSLTGVITPSSPFKSGEKITVVVTTGVAGGGQSLTSPYTFEFMVPGTDGPDTPDGFVKVAPDVSTTTTSIKNLHATDVDGDGDIDLLAAYSNNVAWFQNDGNGSFTEINISTSVNTASSVYAADLEGDGDMDIISTSVVDQRINWHQNDGNENFVQSMVNTTTTYAEDAYAADLDGDGDVDIVEASISDEIWWYNNNGMGSFAETKIADAINARAVYAADVDSDGDMDVLAAFHNSIGWYDNDGAGTFSSVALIDNVASEAVSVAAADIDGDGDMDVVSASKGTDRIYWYENNGGQAFTRHEINISGFDVTQAKTMDMDGDGDIDVVASSNIGGAIKWYENDGSGSFSDRIVDTEVGAALTIAAADFDGDGSIDIVEGHGNSIVWYRNASAAPVGYSVILNQDPITNVNKNAVGFTMLNAEPGTTYKYTFTSSGGGTPVTDSDIVTQLNYQEVTGIDLSTLPDGTIELSLTLTDADNNVGEPATDTSQKGTLELLSPTNNTTGVANAENVVLKFNSTIDGATANKDNIIIHGNYSGIISGVFTTDGSDVIFNPDNDFKPGELISITLTTNVKGGNGELLPGSKQLKLIAGVTKIPSNNEFFSFEVTNTAAGTKCALAGDMDGDGDLDIVASHLSANNIVWYANDGDGNFGAPVSIINGGSVANPRLIYLADVDSDGDLDVLSASQTDDRIAWYPNNGDGIFGNQKTVSTTADNAISVYAADVDGDGDMDILSASNNDDKIAWYENDGAQSFTSHTINGSATGALFVRSADVDNDGDMDVLSTSGDGKVNWYKNNGSEDFSSISTVYDGQSPYSVDDNDFDSDGDTDLVVAFAGSDDKIRWFRNFDNSDFDLIDMDPPVPGDLDPLYVYSADIDGDTYMDVISASYKSDEVTLYNNNGSGSFTSSNISTTASGASSVFAADLDGDGDLDILSANADNNTIIWYENRDVTSPSVNISGSQFTSSNSFQVTVTFNEPVSGFEANDLTIGNGTVDVVTINEDGTYNVGITADGVGLVTINIAVDVAVDEDGNGNEAAEQFTVEYCPELATWYADTDGDGYGDANSSVEDCSQPQGHVSNSNDCDDGDAAINPDATDINDKIDNNCDGNVDENNIAPTVANAISNLGFQKGFVSQDIDFSNIFTDGDGDLLTYFVASSNENVVTAATNGSILTLTEVSIGTSTITLTADDGFGGTVDESFDVFVNSSPTVSNALSDQSLDEGFGSNDVDLSNVFTDVDGDALNYTAISSNEGVVTVATTDNMLTLTEVGVGTSTITVKANDGKGGTVDNTFTVNVNEVANNAPTVSNAIADQTLDEGFGTKEIDLTSVFTDSDGDALSITAGSADEGVVTTSISGNSLTLTDVGVGTSTITVTANDGKGGEVSDVFTVNVNAAVNNAPTVSNAIADQTFDEGFGSNDIDLSNVFNDIDGDALNYTAISSDEGVVTTSIVGNILTLTEVGVSTASITVTANDGNGGSENDVFVVTVSEVLGLEEEEIVLVYPNPVDGALTIELPDNTLTISLFNSLGQKVKAVNPVRGSESLKMNIEELGSGMYMLIIETDKNQLNKTVLKR